MDRIKRENRFLPGKHRPEASTPSGLTTLALANKLTKRLSGLEKRNELDPRLVNAGWLHSTIEFCFVIFPC